MNRVAVILVFLLPANVAFAETIIYLHGRIIEIEGVQPVHDQYGLYDYRGIVAALRFSGATVVSDVRTGNPDVVEYARKIVDQVEALILSGVRPESITVVGFSKGGIIAIYVAKLLNHADVNFVFLAACSDWLSAAPELTVSGNILSIYEKSDTHAGSCSELLQRNDAASTFREIELSTGKGHGAFYLPATAWLEPLLAWIRSNHA